MTDAMAPTANDAARPIGAVASSPRRRMVRRCRVAAVFIAAGLLAAVASIGEATSGSSATLGTVWRGQGGVLSSGPGYPNAGSEAVFQRQAAMDSVSTVFGAFGRVEFTSKLQKASGNPDAATLAELHRATRPHINRDVRKWIGRDPTESELSTILGGGACIMERGAWMVDAWRYFPAVALLLVACGLGVLASAVVSLRRIARSAAAGGCRECGYAGVGAGLCPECGAARTK